MAGRPLDAVEREQLCDLFASLGPDAPTLAEGWTTCDLAAHLVMRERNPRAPLAILGGSRGAGLHDRLIATYKKRGFEKLVDQVRNGPPLVGPWRIPGLRTLLNLNEYFVHHEDVRRANGLAPRTEAAELDAALWRILGRAGRVMVRGLKGAGLAVEAPGCGRRSLRKGSPTVTLTGPPQELVLYLNGRRAAAQIELTGDDAALEALAAAHLGV